MSMKFWDSFGHYEGLVQMALKWDVVAQSSLSIGTPATIAQGTTTGRFGAGGVEFATTLSGPTFSDSFAQTASCYIQKNYNGVSVIHIALAVQQTGTQFPDGGLLCAFLDGGTTQVQIFILPSGQLRATKSALAGTGIFLIRPDRTPVAATGNYEVLGESTASIASSSFEFLQIRITHHPSAGEVKILRGDGSEFWTLSSVNTAVSGVNNSSSVVVGGYAGRFASGATLESHYLKAKISDFHLLDTVANGDDALDPVTFVGDRHWERISLTADGNYAQWTPSTGSTHFDLIEEVPPNTTDYNSSSTVGNKDSFVVSAASGPSTASLFLGLTMYLQKTSGGADEVKGLFRLGGADRNGTAFAVPSPFAFRQSFLASKPGGGAITVADVQPATGQPGYEKTA